MWSPLLLTFALASSPPPLRLELDGDRFALVVDASAARAQVQWQDDHAIGHYLSVDEQTKGERDLEGGPCGTDFTAPVLEPGRYPADTAFLFYLEPRLPGRYLFRVPAALGGRRVVVELPVRVNEPAASDEALVLRALDRGPRCVPADAAVAAFKRIGTPALAARLLAVQGLNRSWRRDLAGRFLYSTAPSVQLAASLAPLLDHVRSDVATDAAALLATASRGPVQARARAQLLRVTGSADRDEALHRLHRREPSTTRACTLEAADALALAALLEGPRFVVDGPSTVKPDPLPLPRLRQGPSPSDGLPEAGVRR